MKTVPIRKAKVTLSRLIAAAQRGEPTVITRRGKPAAVLVPVEEARRLYPADEADFADFLLGFPGGIELERDPSPVRDVAL